jgi:exodeoxyribonuclease-5
MIDQAITLGGSAIIPGFSPDQQAVFDAIMDWRSAWPATKQTFALGGLAGTGKTTIVSYLARCLPKPVIACPTGKAANVLQSKGVDARTIHSLIYEPFGKSNGQVRFRLRRHLDAETLIIDEASMVTSKIHGDLCSFSKPILFVGDHGQLEPVGENANLMKDPDVCLEQIHRQAEGNPIIRLAKAFRDGRENQVRAAMRNGIWQDQMGRCTVTTRSRLDAYLHSGMQVIVGFNKPRHELNSKIRGNLGRKGAPSPGEKLICLQNNARFNLFNGQECVVTGVRDQRGGIVELELEIEDGRLITAPCLARQFGVGPIKDHRDVAVLLMDFGYVLTVHKAQGSAWPEVLVLESTFASSWDARRWRYTATTRARERIVYCW